MQSVEETKMMVEKNLIKQVQKKYPETAGMKDKVTVVWALRKLLQSKKEGN